MNNLNRYSLYIQNIADILALSLAFALARFIKFSIPFFHGHSFSAEAYWRLYTATLVAYVIINIFVLAREDFLHRDKTKELLASIKLVGYILVFLVLYSFFTKTSMSYSREFMVMFAGLSVIFLSAFRILVKNKIFPLYQSGKQAKKTVVVGPLKNVEDAIQHLKDSEDWRYHIEGIIVTDVDYKGEYIDSFQVISNDASMFEDIKNEQVDSLFIVPDKMDEQTMEWVDRVCGLGKDVHVNMNEYGKQQKYMQITDTLGDYTVMSYLSVLPVPKRQAFIKRVGDIILSLVALPLFVLVYILSFIFTDLESRGPIVCTRVRVSRNGRRFYQYRFRMLRTDAEKRIKEKKNPFTKFGMILFTTHLDGLPMILNVLSGDMSFVGPHSPTFPSYVEYDAERRKNLSIKCGIVGYWSCQTNRKQIIRGEREYIENWTIAKDIKILLTMIARFLIGQSSKMRSKRAFQEELSYIQELNEFNQPLSYDHSVYSTSKTPWTYGYLFIKRVFDIVLSLVAIVVLSPVLLILTILVIADDGGSPLYGHERIGENGTRIKVYKFRSMRTDAGDLNRLLTPEQLEQYKNEFKIDDDPRITKIGNFIRKTSLDELPQLFNILFGQLSIVGPRPIVEKETQIYGKDIAKLLSVKPGLTGYWQAYARNNATYESGERQRMEMYYVDHRSLWLDVKVIFKTFSSVLKREGAQ